MGRGGWEQGGQPGGNSRGPDAKSGWVNEGGAKESGSAASQRHGGQDLLAGFLGGDQAGYLPLPRHTPSTLGMEPTESSSSGHLEAGHRTLDSTTRDPRAVTWVCSETRDLGARGAFNLM